MDAFKMQTKREKEKETVSLMIRLYCRGKHGTKTALCEECRALEQYARARTDQCPFTESKSFCSICAVHCYSPEMRGRIRAVMRYSGPRMIFYHPVLAVRHAAAAAAEKRSRRKNT